MSAPSTEPSSPFDHLVVEVAQHARARDAAYATPQEVRRRRTARLGLVCTLPILALVAVWNVSLSARATLPPPNVEAVDLARTLVLTVAELEDFIDHHGRLPTDAELSPMLPAATRLTATESGYELAVAAPLVGTLRITNSDDPDAWLLAVRDAVQTPEGA
ncbi:MAG: hypothetical protein HKO98_13835 [Gemmatimonadetes bacterium]|nr:hypothetical protein [Gemmatimonadota bacterium]